jgi:hypothetical protein
VVVCDPGLFIFFFFFKATTGTGQHDMSEGVSASANNTPRYSSSPELSSPPRSLSDPDSPSAKQLFNEEHRHLLNNHSITVHPAVVDGMFYMPSFFHFLSD